MKTDTSPTLETATDCCTDFKRFLEILHPNGVYEIRSLKCPEQKGGKYQSTASGYFNNSELAAASVAELNQLNPPAIYVSVNPVADALLARANNRVVHKSTKTTSKADVLRRRWLFIDIDVVRASGISSTNAELAAAKTLGGEIASAMIANGWPEPLRGMSGNGSYLFWRIDLPNDTESEDLIRRVLVALAKRFNTKAAEVDLTPFDANRICKVLGTIARKGDHLVDVPHIPDRPHRKSWFIEPQDELEIVPKAALRELADSIPADTTQESTQSENEKWIDTWLSECNVPVSAPVPYNGGRKWLFTSLPKCCESHGHQFDGSSCIIEGPDEKLGAMCQHNHCTWSWRDLRAAYESAVTRDGTKHTKYGSGPDGWDDPVPVDLPSLPSIPIDGLPDRLREWIAATAEATQTPVELAALLALAACSGMVARRIEIEPGRGWIEPINLFVAALLDPGNRKSSVFRAAFDAIRKIETELIEAARPAVAKAHSERRILEAQLKQTESKVAKGDVDVVPEVGNLAEQLAALPEAVLPRLLVDDATAEAVEMQLAAQGGRLIVAGAEGGLFDVIGGRYSKGAANLDAFLKGHAGDDLRVDRVIRSSVVDRVCLTLCYAIQPDVIRGLAGKPSFRGRGLLGRFLYALPASPLGRRKIKPDPVDDQVLADYENLIRDLYSLGGDDEANVRRLQLSSNATDRFDDWQAEVETWLRPDGELASLKDWGGKLVGLTARLAAVIHLAKWAGRDEHVDPCLIPVNVDAVDAAVAIARWAVPHARAAIGLMAGDDGSVIDADAILRWLKKRAVDDVSRRDIGQQFRTRFDRDEKRFDRALEVLIDRGWLRPVDDQGGRAGRPSLRFNCHPRIQHPPRVAGVV